MWNTDTSSHEVHHQSQIQDECFVAKSSQSPSLRAPDIFDGTQIPTLVFGDHAFETVFARCEPETEIFRHREQEASMRADRLRKHSGWVCYPAQGRSFGGHQNKPPTLCLLAIVCQPFCKGKAQRVLIFGKSNQKRPSLCVSVSHCASVCSHSSRAAAHMAHTQCVPSPPPPILGAGRPRWRCLSTGSS